MVSRKRSAIADPAVDRTVSKVTFSSCEPSSALAAGVKIGVCSLDDSTSPGGSATPQTVNLEELAAVTPVANAATRFLAADLLGDVAKGYRNDYDRKRAQLIIARLEQAVQAHTNNVVPYDGVSTAVNGVIDFLRVWTKIGEKTPNGTYILGTSSFAELQTKALSAGTNGPLAGIFTAGRDGIPASGNLIAGNMHIVAQMVATVEKVLPPALLKA